MKRRWLAAAFALSLSLHSKAALGSDVDDLMDLLVKKE